ncbi:MAG TPA: chromosome segregation protein SMC, partial [Fervidobacterium sp.]|nr:chromosome segregation protein SMC [Fervidobacterium sp.]
KDYENYREKIQLLQEQIQSKLQQKEDKLQEKFHMLVSDGTLIFAWASIDFAFRQNSTFSKSYDFLPQEEIRKALESNKCPICQKELDEEHIKLFGELLNAGETYIMSQERYQELMYNIVNFKYREESINIELGKIEKELRDLEEQMGKYQELIRNQDINLFDTLHEERDTLQKALETQSENIGITAENIKNLEQRHKEIEEQIRQLISNDIESKKNLLKADSVKQLSEIINNTVEQRKEQIRKEIERYTMDYLDRLMWKKELIKEVELDEDFTLRVYDESGRIILDRLSGGERSILTLSFAMALHKAVGVNIPIVIDRPLTNISGSSYKEMLEVLSNISKERQIIITLTDREYMDDTVPLLNQKAASINIIDLDQESNVYLKNVK